MKKLSQLIVFTFLSLLMISCSSSVEYDLVLENVGFFDGEQDHGVVNIGINADTLAVISKVELKSDSFFDATDKYLIPGLVNSHVHIWKEEHLKEGYKDGVLALIGLHASSLKRDKNLKDMSMKNGYPYYFTAGHAATVPGGHPTQISSFEFETINDSMPVKKWIDKRIAENIDFIKIVRDSAEFLGHPPLPTLPYDSIEKMIDYSHSKGYKTVVHTALQEEMMTIAKFQPEGLVHLNPEKGKPLRRDQVETLKSSGVFIVPTAILFVKSWDVVKPNNPAHDYMIENSPTPETVMQDIKNMHDAGIMIVAGTDAGSVPFVNWGDDLLYEMDIYSNAGMSNLEVLKSATGNAAKAWDIPIGKLEVGSDLNMVLLSGNPIENLDNLKQVEKVFKNGKAN